MRETERTLRSRGENVMKNNFFDKNQIMNDNILSGPQKFDVSQPSFVVNLDVLSTGAKSDSSTQRLGSDTRLHFEYHKQEKGVNI